jgi:hypothetical protein
MSASDRCSNMGYNTSSPLGSQGDFCTVNDLVCMTLVHSNGLETRVQNVTSLQSLPQLCALDLKIGLADYALTTSTH